MTEETTRGFIARVQAKANTEELTIRERKYLEAVKRDEEKKKK